MDLNVFFLATIFAVKIFSPAWLGSAFNWNFIGQFVSVNLLVVIIFGLTIDGDRSITGKLFRYF